MHLSRHKLIKWTDKTKTKSKTDKLRKSDTETPIGC